jgi:glycosyltransferase involved in cell wall biosynthesis
LRVLIIAPLSANVIGGQEVEAMLILRRWQHDPEVEASFVPNNPRLPNGLRILETVRYLRTTVRLPIYLALVWQAAAKVDILHIFSASYSSFVLNCIPVWLIARLRRKRFVLHYHTARGWKKFANSSLVRFVLKRINKIVVPSIYLAGKFEQIGFAASVVPNIIDEDRFKYRPRKPLRPIAISTRNLSPDYGIEVIIHAFAIVRQYYPHATLYLLGDGPLRQTLEARVRALRISRLFFCGAIPNEKMSEWYERADIFVNASFVDNAPLSILEAMASGVPVVTTTAGGITYMVKHEETALLCPLGDSRAIAEGVMRLLREPELALQIARRAHEQASTYSWSVVRKKWLEAYGLQERSDPGCKQY